jgi:uncharacterized membrane protein YhaH (DUF805 family)
MKFDIKKKGQMTLGGIIGIFVTGLVGVSLLGTIATESLIATQGNNLSNPISTNVTGAAASITDLIPLFFVLIILFVFVIAIGMRRRR